MRKRSEQTGLCWGLERRGLVGEVTGLDCDTGVGFEGIGLDHDMYRIWVWSVLDLSMIGTGLDYYSNRTWLWKVNNFIMIGTELGWYRDVNLQYYDRNHVKWL